MTDANADGGDSFDGYRQILRLLARTQLGPRLRRVVDESDIVQQTLLEACQQQQQCRARTPVERFAWLRRILTNTVIDTVRRYARDKRDISREVDWEPEIRGSALRAESWLADQRSSPSQLLERREDLVRLAEALYRLPEPQREAIVRFHLEGCSLSEVAEQMGRSSAAVAGLINRGLKQLRQLLHEPSRPPSMVQRPGARERLPR